MKTLFKLAFFSLFSCGTTFAAPVFINFEGAPSGSLSGYEYATQGVVFASVNGSGVQEYNYGGYLSEIITSDNWYNPLRISFVNPTDSNQAWTVASFSLENKWSEDYWDVTAYDINNVAIGNQILSYTTGTINFSGIGGIHSVVLNASQTAFAADNLKFDGLAATQPVPEPETYAMLALGLGVVSLTARRKQKRIA